MGDYGAGAQDHRRAAAAGSTCACRASIRTSSIEGSLNIPLYFIRLKLSTLDRTKPYVVYCDTGRRSSAAAYILVERGFDAYVLSGGLGNGGGLQLTRGGAADKP